MKKNLGLFTSIAMELAVFSGTILVILAVSYTLPRLWNSSSIQEAVSMWFLWTLSGIFIAKGVRTTIEDIARGRGYDI